MKEFLPSEWIGWGFGVHFLFFVFCFPVRMLRVSFKETETTEDLCSWNKSCWGLREALAHAGIHSGVRQTPKRWLFLWSYLLNFKAKHNVCNLPRFHKIFRHFSLFFPCLSLTLLNTSERLSSDFAFKVKKTSYWKYLRIHFSSSFRNPLWDTYIVLFKSNKAVVNFTVLSAADQLSCNENIFSQLPNIIFT